MAERLGCAVVVLRHLTKTGGNNPLYRGSGSLGMIGAARSGILVGNLPDQSLGGPLLEGTRHAVARTKGNLAKPWPTLVYVIVGEQGSPHLHWLKDTPDVTAADILAAADAESRGGAPVVQDDETPEVTFLRDELAGGRRKADDLIALGEKHRLSYKALTAARYYLHVVTERVGFGADGCFWWSLPGSTIGVEGDSETMAENGENDAENAHCFPIDPIDSIDSASPACDIKCVRHGVENCPICESLPWG
jgi:hypothetical protein